MKIADPRPAYCSGCYQPVNDQPMVDFQASYDGPVIPGTPEPVPIDDLVLCESCVRTAAGMIGLEDAQTLRDELAASKHVISDLNDSIESKDETISDLNHTVTTLVDETVHRPARRPALIGVPEDIRAKVTTKPKPKAKVN